MVGLIRQLASELAPTIRVNGVAPGGTITDIRGLDSFGLSEHPQFADEAFLEGIRRRAPLGVLEPRDHAGAYVLLASSDNSSGMTGTVLTTDAGTLLRIRREV